MRPAPIACCWAQSASGSPIKRLVSEGKKDAKKKAPPESQERQSERFKRTVSDAVAAGELNPTEADAAVAKLVQRSKRT